MSAFGPNGIYFVLFFFFTAKTKGHGEQTCQEEIFRRRRGKRNWPGKYSHVQGVP